MFEVAVPNERTPVDASGFLLDNAHGNRERDPRFCGVPEPLKKDKSYRAAAC